MNLETFDCRWKLYSPRLFGATPLFLSSHYSYAIMGNENASDFYHLSSAHVGKLASRTNVKSGQWLPYRIGSLGTLTAAVSNRSIVVVSLCYCSLSEYACLHRWCTEAEPSYTHTMRRRKSVESTSKARISGFMRPWRTTCPTHTQHTLKYTHIASTQLISTVSEQCNVCM